MNDFFTKKDKLLKTRDQDELASLMEESKRTLKTHEEKVQLPVEVYLDNEKPLALLGYVPTKSPQPVPGRRLSF